MGKCCLEQTLGNMVSLQEIYEVACRLFYLLPAFNFY